MDWRSGVANLASTVIGVVSSLFCKRMFRNRECVRPGGQERRRLAAAAVDLSQAGSGPFSSCPTRCAVGLQLPDRLQGRQTYTNCCVDRGGGGWWCRSPGGLLACQLKEVQLLLRSCIERVVPVRATRSAGRGCWRSVEDAARRSKPAAAHCLQAMPFTHPFLLW